MGVEIEAGGVYTSKGESFAREVLEITGYDVVYRDFELLGGEPWSSRRKCTRATFRNWAVRRCSAEESARLRRDLEPREDREFLDMVADLVGIILKGVSDAEILAEARRRNLIHK